MCDIKQQPINGRWILKGATEALKDNLRKYPTYDDLRKEHNDYWQLENKLKTKISTL